MITSGVFGYFGYDSMHLVERIPAAELPDPAGMADVCLLFCDTLVVFDNIMRKMFIIANHLDENGRGAAQEKIETIAESLYKPLQREQIDFLPEAPEPVVSNTTRMSTLQRLP